jgi:cell division protein FtsQ
MKKILPILFLIPVLYMIILPFFISASASSRLCSRVSINIIDSSDYNFVTKSQLLNLVYSNGGKIIGMPVKEIKMTDIENRINDLRELKEAEVYTSIDGTLHVYIDQRNPVMRVIPDEGGDYFIDEDGFVFRRRSLYTPRLHIVEGNIDITPAMLDRVSILDTSIKNTILKDVYDFVRYINSSSFWSAQIDQIYVDRKDEIDLIPRVGNHIIHLGTFEDYRDKLRNLNAFYDKVLPEVGWNKYSVVDLEFRDQIVCKRRQ